MAGDFQIAHISSANPPSVYNSSRQKGPTEQMDAEAVQNVIARPDEGMREEVVREYEGDALAGEQTWPTEEVSQCHRVTLEDTFHRTAFCSTLEIVCSRVACDSCFEKVHKDG